MQFLLVYTAFRKRMRMKNIIDFFPHLYLVVGFSRKTEGEVKYWTRGELTSKATLVLVRSKVNGSDVLLHHTATTTASNIAVLHGCCLLLHIEHITSSWDMWMHPLSVLKCKVLHSVFRCFFFFRFFLAQAHIDRERFCTYMYVPTKLKVACTYSHMDFFHAYTFWGKQLCWCMYV